MQTEEATKTVFTEVGEDAHGRRLFTCSTSAGRFVDVDGILHTMTKDGEPLFPIREKTPEKEA